MFNALVASQLYVDAVKNLLLCQYVEYTTNCLEEDRWVLVKKFWETPSFEWIVPPDQQIWTFIDLNHRHCTSTFNTQIVDIETKIMDDFVLLFRLVKLRVNVPGFEETSKQDRLVGLLKFFVEAELCLSIVAPDKKSVLGCYSTWMDHTCCHMCHIAAEKHILCILIVT